MQVVRVRPDLRGLLVAPGRPPTLPWPAACQARLRFGHRSAGGLLRGTVQLACRTSTARVFTTLVWAAPMDDRSRRLLAEALQADAQQPCAFRLRGYRGRRVPARLEVTGNRRRPPVVHLASQRRPPEAAAAPAALPAAVDDLRAYTGRRLRLGASGRTAADRRAGSALSALHGLFALLNSYLEEVLRLHVPHVVARQALRTSILQTRSRLDHLAACRAPRRRFP